MSSNIGKTSRKQYTPEFKAQVVLEALKEQSTLAELAKKYEFTDHDIALEGESGEEHGCGAWTTSG